MGCRLPKLRKAEERQSPGKIYSTLRRPQVETKVGVAYTYHFLDFLLGKEEVAVSSVLCLSSVRELPVQVRELYAQGFVLVALHPFVHPCGPRHARVQRQLHRAVLLRETPQSSEKSPLKWAGHRLETDVCVAGRQAPDPEAIQNYVKKIQDVSEQGVMFVGFLQQPGGGPCFLGPWGPEDLSSLHSSPSPIHRHSAFSSGSSPSDPGQPPTHLRRHQVYEPERRASSSTDLTGTGRGLAGEPTSDPSSPPGTPNSDPSAPPPEEPLRPDAQEPPTCPTTTTTTLPQGPQHICGEGLRVLRAPRGVCPLAAAAAAGSLAPAPTGGRCSPPPGTGRRRTTERRLSADPAETRAPEDGGPLGNGARVEPAGLNNNNHVWNSKQQEEEQEQEEQRRDALPPLGELALGRTQLFALYNHTGELENASRFYSLRVPLCVQKEAGITTEVDAHWLDHMTQHFTGGARLIDGFFNLADDEDSGMSSVDSVFIFQSPAEENAVPSYDAIVVEQWTVVDGVVVRTDYIPLLQSLAPYGWRLMCVLPTPVVRTNSDGSLSTKQVLFLQRPVLQRKRKDFKMLNLRGRSKARRSYGGDAPEKERESTSPASESEADELLGTTKQEEEEGGGEWMEDEEERKEGKVEGEDTWGGKEAITKEAEDQTDVSPPPPLSPPPPPLSEDAGSVAEGNREEEEEESARVGWVPAARREKSVRWTDVCQRAHMGEEEEQEEEEEEQEEEGGRAGGRMMPQLSERALFSGVC